MKIEKNRTDLVKNDEETKIIFGYLKKLLMPENTPGNPIGFGASEKTN
jgi:hypothetical protein